MKKIFQYAISITLTLFFLYFAFRGTNWTTLFDSLRTANYWWAMVMFFFLMLSHSVRAYRWKYFLAPIKANIRYRNLFSTLMLGYMVNNFLPRGGELLRPYTLGRLEGISRSAALGTVMMERLIDVFSFLVLVALIPLCYAGPLAEKFPWLMEMSIILSIVTLIILGIILFLLAKRSLVFSLLHFFTKRFRETTAHKIEHIAHSFLDGFLFIKEKKNYLMIFVTSVLVWTFYIIMMYCAFFMFDAMKISSLDIYAAVVLQAISSIGVAIPTPGGTGSYHFITIQTLTQLYNINETVARSYATITHAIGYFGVLLIGVYFFIRDHLQFSDVVHTDSSTTE
ncbi:MAG: lysylphosphatidylglycerol synthase transmembrane domain-containing protein [Bacteroidota bacterium]